ncbi:Zinc finger protein MAGPIE [Morus notabilis]|uniref:Zinc finger protein MAGPIE n=2 Tax=Morus notabilis TaxID=981085 RepID=W9QUZ5_9ROSA|nr:Zinc finger protein MAGPIE [Morus notabilis]
MATNRFLCEVCGKGFQRDQNLQLHRRGHNLPWKLKQRSSKEPKKRVYVCPEKTCVHHHPSRALGDLTGIKKHFCRKHGEKKWKCDKCSKRYAVQSDWKAHSKTCGTREYKCDCGTLFSRRDSFITHRAFCDALAEETARVKAASDHMSYPMAAGNFSYHFTGASVGANMTQHFPSVFKPISSPNDVDATIGGGATTRGLSLWMGQGVSQLGQEAAMANNNVTSLQEIHQLGTVSSSGPTIFRTTTDHHHPLSVSCSNPPPPSDYHHHLNWVLGSSTNKLSSNSSTISTTSTTHDQELTTTSLPLRNNNNVKEAASSNNQLVSVPSLYSTQHTSHHQTPPSSANMSATALLQKAAQIGATSTDSSFLGSFGLKCNNNNSTQVQEGSNKSCGLYGSNIISTTVESQEGDHLLQIYRPAKRRHVQGSEEGTTGGGAGQTRDFLGVGVQAICHPSSINGWI